MIRFLYCIFLSAIFIFSSYCQNDSLIQFSGIVLDKESDETLEFVNIIVNNKKGTITDKYGRFSFITNNNDTIFFSSVGYKKDTILISSLSNSNFITYDVYLVRDTILIDEVEILPWATYKDFAEAFVKLELPDDDLKRAERNIELMKMQALASDEPDPNINYRNSVNAQHEKNFTYGMYPINSLLNPFAWAKFFEALKRGDFRNNNK
ncbi:carboxypeptidase-like regulatory domain-containing protein [Bacteroidota bacterium]